ncbi:hypothetical protein J7T55_005483 [Diaporthe amygdali]|uniref:uncharacterized protein n=1 Tax=Phomopsis amygdali TaxID=1214568 RepID=UPI0022FE587B|nr:uncharacterized protein J7T55_005483 [Diaporthe amygdali]KAJ0108937.1 hypothetical protein J7T55_005483 [Diaporthe amygdali]
MLRRPPTVLTLTSEDVKAYEDRREAEAFQHATAAAQARRHQQLARNMSGMDITGITTSSDEEDYSEQEASYYPNRTYSQNARVSREENIDGPRDEEIYRNEENSDDYEDASDGDHVGEEGFVEDEDMAMAEAGLHEEQMDLDADNNINTSDDVSGGAVPNLQHPRRQQQPIFPSPPPAPSRMTRSTRSVSTEPASSQQQQQQQQQQAAAAAAAASQQQPAGRFARGATAAQTHRRAPSGRAAAEAVTPTPVAQAQRDAADRARARVTRSRDERIGVARGGRR